MEDVTINYSNKNAQEYIDLTRDTAKETRELKFIKYFAKDSYILDFINTSFCLFFGICKRDAEAYIPSNSLLKSISSILLHITCEEIEKIIEQIKQLNIIEKFIIEDELGRGNKPNIMPICRYYAYFIICFYIF